VTTTIKLRKRESIRLLVLVAVLSLLLPLLAALQYRWLGQLSDAERAQMREILQVAASRFSQDFDGELAAAYNSFRPEPALSTAEETWDYSTRYARWISSSQFPRLIKDIWLVTAGENSSLDLKRLAQANRQFQDWSWPAEMDGLREQFARRFRNMQSPLGPQSPDRRTPRGEPMGMQMPPIFDRPPAIIIPIFRMPVIRDQKEIAFRPPPGFILLTLDLDYIREETLPELTRRHFPGESGLNYQITIVRRDDPKTVIFRTGPLPALSGDAGGQAAPRGGPDVTAGLFGARFGNFPRPQRGPSPSEAESARKGPPPPGGENAGSGRPGGELRPPGFDPGMFRNPGMNPGDGLWQIQIQHRAGSLDAAVTNARRRNLAISFSILVLLGGSVISIVISTRHARRLAQQQVEFVAAVTHELRTPISVIHMAAQNLADGVIKGSEQTSRYGTLISRESRRLAGMIEQVLEFASGESRREDLDLRNLHVVDLIDSAISATQPLIQEGGFQIEREIQPDLPDVMGDEPSLRRALQNLLDNAMKFSGSNRWIGLKAQAHSGRRTGEVKITIQDRGMGIPQDELGHIFDPFFRGKALVSAQIRGNGLGLSLVKSIIEAHGGRIAVDSMEGRGTNFSIFLPVAAPVGGVAAQVNRQQDGDRPTENEDR
jgi:signal transduction histidine kinase